ncbi:hypothetical protein [Kibdelosporangium phytohabitans]|uniref:Uncharacterized protein n=1 Tax=Kibdelosporangium phytohabitans TaxID=860235 RepID=A0A0N9HP95_9PSEU|nr:hypothetical protein [Kibdelosporangium phytohabitans]ALG06229.1 hypothetical protein AOZ06_04165 [Kibdelosporangium phytohabitans]MBE1465670.1 hypothetical protein [Kibdelosporangium phytohabitans]
MTDQPSLNDTSKLPGDLGDTVGDASSGISGLVNSVISAGSGGTVTQGMVDQASKIKSATGNG